MRRPILVVIAPAVLALVCASCGSESGSSEAGNDSVAVGGSGAAERATQAFGIVSCRKSAEMTTLPNGDIQLSVERKCAQFRGSNMRDVMDLGKSWLKSQCPEVRTRWFDSRVNRWMNCKIIAKDQMDFSGVREEIVAKQPGHCGAETLALTPMMAVCSNAD